MKDVSENNRQAASVTLLKLMHNARLVDVRISPVGVEKPFDGADIIAQDGIWLTLQNEDTGMGFRVPLFCPVCKNTIHFDEMGLQEIQDMVGCYLGDIRYHEYETGIGAILAGLGPQSLHSGKVPHSSIGLVFFDEQDPKGGGAYSVHPLSILYAEAMLPLGGRKNTKQTGANNT